MNESIGDILLITMAFFFVLLINLSMIFSIEYFLFGFSIIIRIIGIIIGELIFFICFFIVIRNFINKEK